MIKPIKCTECDDTGWRLAALNYVSQFEGPARIAAESTATPCTATGCAEGAERRDAVSRHHSRNPRSVYSAKEL